MSIMTNALDAEITRNLADLALVLTDERMPDADDAVMQIITYVKHNRRTIERLANRVNV